MPGPGQGEKRRQGTGLGGSGRTDLLLVLASIPQVLQTFCFLDLL